MATAGAAAVVTSGRKTQAKTSDAADTAVQPSGYHVTEHMLKYYKTTKV